MPAEFCLVIQSFNWQSSGFCQERASRSLWFATNWDCRAESCHLGWTKDLIGLMKATCSFGECIVSDRELISPNCW